MPSAQTLSEVIMRRVSVAVVSFAAVALVAPLVSAQDVSNKVAGGGISVAGWSGTTEEVGRTIADSKFTMEAKDIHVTTGPATTYWAAANRASGNYTVKATFTEPKFQNLMTHPHPYGLVIAGNDMGTATQSYLYCAVNGNGSFIVRGFGPAPFQMNGGRGEANAAVHKAAAKDESVTNDVAIAVTADKIECSINGTVVASYAKADLVAAGKLKSTDGVYGVRFAHNTEGIVSGLAMTKK
jgi:hypothetical protein